MGVARLVLGCSGFHPGVAVIERHEYGPHLSGLNVRARPSTEPATPTLISITPASAGPSKATPRREAAAYWGESRPCRFIRGQGRALLLPSGGSEIGRAH